MTILFNNQATKRILCFIAVPLCFLSCIKGEKSCGYVTEYVRIETMKISMVTQYATNTCLSIWVSGKSFSFWDKGYTRHVYDSLQAIYGDTGWNQKVYHNQFVTGLIPGITKINLASDKDFDNSHPAGTSLNDCATILYHDLLEYIEGGYNGKPEEIGCKKIPLSDYNLNPGGLFDRFAFVGFVLYIDKLPDTKGKHLITVSLQLENGEWMQDDVEIVY